MIWIIVILIVVVIFLFKANKETIEISKVPFEVKYAVLLAGLNIKIFKGKAEYMCKDIREHYLIRKTDSKIAYIEFINRENSLYLTYYERDVMGHSDSVSQTYSETKNITEQQQTFIVKTFYDKVTDNFLI